MPVTIQDIAKIPLLEIRRHLFKNNSFDFIVTHKDKDTKEWKTHEKQKKALEILTDNITKEFAFGGAAGGGKSILGCSWLTFMALCYPGTRWFAGRNELKALRQSTYISFLKVFQQFGVKTDIDYKYNGQDNFFQFSNGSRIDLISLGAMPSDPLFERFGSMEFTGGWIEEAGEITMNAYDTIKTRINRHLNDKYGIMGKLFITLNPKKNWVHQYFWKPFKAGLLGPDSEIKFLQSLVQDNPFGEKEYENNLRNIKDKIKRERLFLGNFDYDDDENALITYDAISDLYTNSHALRGKKYITADIARFGKDTTTIWVWDNWVCIKQYTFRHLSVPESAKKIADIAVTYGIGRSQIVVDDDGVGGGVVDILHCKGFVNNSSPMLETAVNGIIREGDKQNYENLKTQCYYILAGMINDRLIWVQTEDEELKEKLGEELEQVKRRDPDSDTKLRIIPKETVKELLGRSPDNSDTMMMRIYFELKKPRVFVDREVSWDEL